MWIWQIIIGFVAGLISGMGIGGGTVLIPALNVLFAMDQKAAQNINLLFFIPTGIIALITHKFKGNIEKKGLAVLIFFGLLGATIGAVVAIRTDAALLRKGFGLFLLGMGIYEMLKKDVENNGTKSLRDTEKSVS